jgi:hypothetical protein
MVDEGRWKTILDGSKAENARLCPAYKNFPTY